MRVEFYSHVSFLHRRCCREIGALSNLKELSLRSNRLKTLPDEFAALGALESLNLIDNRLRDLVCGFDDFICSPRHPHTLAHPIQPVALLRCKKLRHLDVSLNSITRCD